MKITRSFKARRFILATTMFACLGLATHATAQERSYLIDLNNRTVTELGTLGGHSSSAYGLNDIGQVVGNSDTVGGASHAFITGPDGIGMKDLGTLGGNFSTARGINEAGRWWESPTRWAPSSPAGTG